MVQVGYKGYYLVRHPRGNFHLVTPSGIPIAEFDRSFYATIRVIPRVKGLDCGSDHKTDEQAIKYIVRQYERLKMSRMERIQNGMYRFFSNGIWGAIAAIAAIIAVILSYLTLRTTSGGAWIP